MSGTLIGQFVQTELKLFAEILGTNNQLAIRARSNGCPSATTDGRRHAKTIVVVRVLADQVHPPRRLEDARRCSEELDKSLPQAANFAVDLKMPHMHSQTTLSGFLGKQVCVAARNAGGICGVSGCAHILDRGQNRLLDGQSGPPTQGTNPRAVQQDKGTVPNPAPLASRVHELGIKTEMLTNPSDRVVDFAILVGTQIENVYLALRPVEGSKDRVDAILHIQIRFPLMAVAQHMQMFRMLGKLLVEIEHVTVRVTLSQNRDESKNVALYSEAFAIGLNQAFRSQLRGAVKGSLDGERTRFRRGENVRLTVDRSR